MSNQDQQPPWGKKNKPQSPEEMVAQLIKKLQDFFSEDKNNQQSQQPPEGEKPAKKPGSPFALASVLFVVVLIVLVVQGVYSSMYKIAPGEVGVILRLGKFARSTQSGLHFKIPYMERLYKVDVEKIRKQEFGFPSNILGKRGEFDRRGDNMESLMLTADKNVINVAWIVQYKVSDPYQYLFKIKNVKQAVHDASESVTRRIVGNMDFDYVLSNRDLLAASVKKELQSELDNLEAGVLLVAVQFKDINPPDKVKPAFNEVNKADQDMKRLVNEAQEQYNRVIPKARGDAKKIVEEAHGYASERINDAKGQTGRFLDILAKYKDAPEVTRQRMYLETMRKVLPNVQTVYVIDKDQQGPLPLLNLSSPNAVKPIQ